ncbi:alpha/beta hydrolase [Alienimonas chondri]|uniref:Acetyl esterase n=1 Tax=Alienimonas chondri TaxID=2681879 RepID=A0ABX1VHB5_9PLAN|nr:alpha/beta hydrolase [Alienimonas chondri]NNJ27270.1 Acetyl esterase [Alienimonas chondri]
MTSRSVVRPFALFIAAVLATPAIGQERTQPVPPGVIAHRDLAYVPDGHQKQKLDLYLPERTDEAKAAPRPLIVWVHGGGWRGGSKNQCPPLRAGFVDRGYAVASVGYRLSAAAPFPAQIEDCRAALRWLRAHADEYGLDKNRIGVWGSSAGGHLVALMGTAGDETSFDVGEHKDVSPRVQAICDFYGPSDLAAFLAMPGYERQGERPGSPVYALLGGPLSEKADLARKASPITYVSKDDPPFLILHGAEDRTVPLDQSERLHKALKDAGVESTLVTLPEAGHGGRDFNQPEIQEQIGTFFDRHLRSQPAE